MVTIYRDSRGNTRMFKDGAIHLIAPASRETGWNICPLAYGGCEGSKDSRRFEEYCRTEKQESCNFIPLCGDFMRSIEQKEVGLTRTFPRGDSKTSQSLNIFQGELIA